MRALLIVRPNAGERPGGDVVAARGVHAALRAADVDADVTDAAEPDARGYDVAHLFGITDPDLQEPQLAAIAGQGVARVISPIWSDRSNLFAVGPRLVRALNRRDARRAERWIAELRAREERLALRAGRGAERWRARQAAMLATATVIVTGSEVEAFWCARTLRVLRPPTFIAHYGMDGGAFDVERAEQRSGVVCVGRLERLKNQAMLLFALRDLDVEITLVGRSFDPEYRALCERWATPRTHFVERLPDAELRALYARTTVHALPSFGDLPGLVTLEAAALGSRVVAGNRGSEHEYLGPEADYCDPLDPASIRGAVETALKRPPRTHGDALEQRLRALRWDRHAATTFDAYRRAIALG